MRYINFLIIYLMLIFGIVFLTVGIINNVSELFRAGFSLLGLCVPLYLFFYDNLK